MNRRIIIPGSGLSSGMALAAMAATMFGGPAIGLERPEEKFPTPVRKPKRRKQADRSKKQYLLKGIRP